MSNSLAVAAVTSSLRTLLDLSMRDNPPGTSVSALPPDRARLNQAGNQLNLFLYHTSINAAWRNMDMPRQVKPNETGVPPLPLRLYYLITAYGENDEELVGHRVLGRAMSVMHDHPVLSAADLTQALPPEEHDEFARQLQSEGVRITFQPLTLEEMFNLWTTFQTPYRISAAYEISVVLIDSGRPSRAPLPVLRQGDDGRGPVASPDLTPPFPVLSRADAPDLRFAAQPGDRLRLTGANLAGAAPADVSVRFRHPALAEPIVISPPATVTDREVTVDLPAGAAAADWAAGILGVDVLVRRATSGGGVEERATNQVPMTLAPKIDRPAPDPVLRDAAGDAALSVTVVPPVRPSQRAALLIGDRYVAPAGPAATTGTLDFVVPGLPPGDYFPRLRVDGVDSRIDEPGAEPPRFDPGLKVTVS